MKTATITWVMHNNFGTALQAYALQNTLFKYGVENEIIFDDFIFSNNNVTNNKKTVNKTYNKFIYHVKRLGRAFLLLFSKKRRETRKRNLALDKKIADFKNLNDRVFHSFKNKYLKLRYINLEDNITNLNLEYDVFIAGSDQTWSPIVFNPYYYLDFVSKKKIAYATSIGVINLPEDKTQEIADLISAFDSISVREDTAKTALQPLYKNEIKVVLDPTLLLSKNDWLEISTPTNKTGYILCYFLECQEWYYEYAEKMSDLLNKEIILIPSRIEHLSKDYVYDKHVDPSGFIGLINDADMIITDSYHGFIFSTILEKKFVLIKRFDDNSEINQNSRIFSLLKIMKLTNSYITEKNAEISDICSPDYDDIKSLINTKKIDSLNYLKGALGLQ